MLSAGNWQAAGKPLSAVVWHITEPRDESYKLTWRFLLRCLIIMMSSSLEVLYSKTPLSRDLCPSRSSHWIHPSSSNSDAMVTILHMKRLKLIALLSTLTQNMRLCLHDQHLVACIGMVEIGGSCEGQVLADCRLHL